jgi:hypothetical protein
MKWKLMMWVVASACVCGCATYQYRVTQPPGVPEVKDGQQVVVHYDPLEYRLSKDHDRLLMQIFNPTDDRVVLVGSRSYVVDPRGESHPLRDRILGGHSFTWILLPPQPMTYAYPGYGGGWGPSWGWYAPYPGPWYGGAYFWSPPVYYAQVYTPYDWDWKTGPVRLRLTYERDNKFSEQNFEILREVK